MCWLKKEKLIDLYLVTPYYGDNIEDIGTVRLLSIEASKDDANKYINEIFYYKNKEHYQAWCETRSLPLDKDTWDLYSKIIITDDVLKEYSITKLTYRLADIARMLSAYSKCINPILAAQI